MVARWESRLWSGGRARAWLRRRGLSEKTIRRFELGYDGEAITIPVRGAGGAIVNLRRRFLDLDADPKIKGLYKRGTQLYPITTLDASPNWLVICEGELDALLLNQIGVAAITSTGGRAHWESEWTEYVAKRARGRVAFVLDADATEIARRRAEEFRAAGIDAHAVDLTRSGHRGTTDVSDLVTKHGWTPRRLRTFLRSAGRRASA
jgi:DNA primase